MKSHAVASEVSISKVLIRVSLFLCVALSSLSAQVNSTDEKTFTFKAVTRRVLLDVVVKDKKGNIVIVPQFDDAWFFNEGLAAVNSNGKWGFIDKKGNFAIVPRYDGAYAFLEGFAGVIELKYLLTLIT